MNSINAARERLLSDSTLKDTNDKNTYTTTDTYGEALKKRQIPRYRTVQTLSQTILKMLNLQKHYTVLKNLSLQFRRVVRVQAH